MNFIIKHRGSLIRLGKSIAFIAAVLGTTKLALAFGSPANISTIAFSFIIIVLLSAFFGDFPIAFITSITAALSFDYYFLPPFRTLNIASFSDWISLATFLLVSVMISYLTASAVEHKTQADILNKSLVQLKKFEEWLLSVPGENLTLTGIAEEASNIFSLKYCSIHVHGNGKWQHFTGATKSTMSRKIENNLETLQDHPIDVMQLAEENMLGVEYINIFKNRELFALLAVKSKTLPVVVMETLAYSIGIRLSTIMESKDFFKQKENLN